MSKEKKLRVGDTIEFALPGPNDTLKKRRGKIVEFTGEKEGLSRGSAIRVEITLDDKKSKIFTSKSNIVKVLDQES